MAHEVESLMLFKEKAWHGLGTIVQEAPTSDDALRLAGLDWIVSPDRVAVRGKEVPGYQANIRESDGQVLGITSTKYKIVQNREAFSFLDSIVGGSLTFESAGSLQGGRRVFMLGQLAPRMILGDKFASYILFTHTFDGLSKMRVALTPTRVVCMNTLRLGLKTATRTWATAHRGDIQSKVKAAREALTLEDIYFRGLGQEAELLATTPVLEKGLIDAFFSPELVEGKLAKKAVERNRDVFVAALRSDNLANFRGTAWAAVQAAADVESHFVPARRTVRFNERRLEFFSSDAIGLAEKVRNFCLSAA